MASSLGPEEQAIFDRAISECFEVQVELVLWHNKEVRLWVRQTADGNLTLLGGVTPRSRWDWSGPRFDRTGGIA
jgi:hypothetical protein